MSARAILCALLVCLAACRRQEAPTTRPPAMHARDMDLAAVPPTPVQGTIAGRVFRSVEAWYRVVRMPGRERVDLILSEGRATRLCGESEPELSRHVWVRFPGITRVTAGTLVVDPPSDTPLSVHYEFAEDEKWRGHGGGSAAIAIDEVRVDAFSGRLKICFDDLTQSCVTGSFHAAECRNELDLDGPRARVRQREGELPP